MAGRIKLTPMGTGPVVPKRSGRSDFNVDDLDLDGFPINYVVIELGRESEDGPPGTGALAMLVAPNVKFPAHYHQFDEIALVLEGSFIVGRTEYGPGVIRLQDGGSVYGPVKSGPNGVKMIGFFAAGPDVRDYHVNEKDEERARELAQEYFGDRLVGVDWG